MKFLSRLFSLFSSSSTPAATQTAPAARPAERPPAPSRPRLFVGWEEMLDAQGAIAAYRLRPKSLQADAAIDGADLLAVLEQEGVRQMAERRPVIIPLSPGQWWGADFSVLATGNSYVLPQTATADFVEQLRVAGFKIAAESTQPEALATQSPAPDLLIVDFHARPLAQIEAAVRTARQACPKLLLAADKVGSWSEHRLAQSLGFAFSLGGFAGTRDDADSGDRLTQSRLVIMDMQNQLRQDAPLAELATTAKRDPAMVMTLLRMANSPLYGLSREIASLDDAIQLLGRDALYRWLAVALFQVDARSGRDQTLLVLALGRARFLESLAVDRSKQQADELFLVGLLSLMEGLLGQPMLQLLSRLQLPDAVKAALGQGEGPYAEYFSLVVAMEQCDLLRASKLAAVLGIDMLELVSRYGVAVQWATSELRAA